MLPRRRAHLGGRGHPGHAPGHLCLWSPADGLLCSGDHLLKPLVPPVAYDDGLEPDPMGSYLESLRLVRTLVPSLVLPGHGTPFSDGAGRAATLEKAKRRRLDQVLCRVSATELTAAQLTASVLPVLPPLPSHHLFVAVTETLACLAYHEVRGRVERRRAADGAFVWRAVG